MVDTFDRVRKIFVEHLVVDAAMVTAGASLVKDLRADSLDEAELIMVFEEEFGIDILDADAETVKTVGDAVALVKRLTP